MPHTVCHSMNIYPNMNPQREWTSDSKRNLWNSFKPKWVTKPFSGNYWNNYKWLVVREGRTSVNESLGVALTAKRAEQLFESGLDTVNISMDTLEPMKAEFITRRPSTFHKGRFQYFFCGVFWMIFIVFSRIESKKESHSVNRQRIGGWVTSKSQLCTSTRLELWRDYSFGRIITKKSNLGPIYRIYAI